MKTLYKWFTTQKINYAQFQELKDKLKERYLGIPRYDMIEEVKKVFEVIETN